MKTRLVLQGDIQELFAQEQCFPGAVDMRGYSVSIVTDELPVLIYRASKNKSRQCKDGAVIVEVTRDLLPRAKVQ